MSDHVYCIPAILKKKQPMAKFCARTNLPLSHINMEFSSTSLFPVILKAGQQWNNTVCHLCFVFTVEKSFHVNHNGFAFLKLMY